VEARRPEVAFAGAKLGFSAVDLAEHEVDRANESDHDLLVIGRFRAWRRAGDAAEAAPLGTEAERPLPRLEKVLAKCDLRCRQRLISATTT
jgi:hypothetical protein